MHATGMTAEQQAALYQDLHRDGYLVLRGVVPDPLVKAARRVLNRALGQLANHARFLAVDDDALAEADASALQARMKRAARDYERANSDPAILTLLNDTAIKPFIEAAMGAPILPARGAQLATLFPWPPSRYVNESGYRDCDTPFHAWHGHLDGLWNGATEMHQDIDTPMTEEALAQWSASPSRNQQPREYPERGVNIGSFTALVGVALSDQTEEGAGNLGVLAGAHHHMERFFQMQRARGGPLGPDGPDWPRVDHTAPNGCGLRHYPEAVRAAFSEGAAQTKDGKLWPKPTFLKLAPGDAVIALHLLPHCGTRVEGPDPRLMAYFRVTSSARSEENRSVYPEALLDIWREWEGVRNVLGR